MPLLSVAAIAAAWLAAGGSPSAQTWAVAVALAESGGNTAAISATADYGLWQIHLAAHPEYASNPSALLDPAANAAAAVAISGNGCNWGPWCTAWANPARDCASGPLSVPQPGSAAAGEYDYVAGALSQTPVPPGTGFGPPPGPAITPPPGSAQGPQLEQIPGLSGYSSATEAASVGWSGFKWLWEQAAPNGFARVWQYFWWLKGQMP